MWGRSVNGAGVCLSSLEGRGGGSRVWGGSAGWEFGVRIMQRNLPHTCPTAPPSSPPQTPSPVPQHAPPSHTPTHLSHSTATHLEQALFQLTPLYCDVILWPEAERCLRRLKCGGGEGRGGMRTSGGEAGIGESGLGVERGKRQTGAPHVCVEA